MLSTDNYGYGNANWGDLLTSYKGNTITYDAIGNPNEYKKNGYGYLYWSGRQLNSMTTPLGDDLGFGYNDSGIRTRKSIGNTYINYTLDGSKILKESATGNQNYTIYYYYDASGSITGFNYNSITYYYGKNVQGDIKYIYNTSGAIVTEYCYDAYECFQHSQVTFFLLQVRWLQLSVQSTPSATVVIITTPRPASTTSTADTTIHRWVGL